MKSLVYKKIVVFISSVFLLIYIAWRMFYTLPFQYGAVALVCGIAMLVCEVVSAYETIAHFITTMNITEPELPDIPEEWYPDVDIFIATHNEPVDVLYKTANGAKHMKYPDKSKVHIWFCDDGNRKAVADLAEKMGIGYQGLANNTLAKAGNLNNALSKTSGMFIATFDADMIPTRNFLMKTVPYFFLPKMKKLKDGTWVERRPEEIDPNYKIGFIQTPQSFYNPDLFQFNLYSEDKIPNEQDYFFREINVSRNTSNSPIYAGSNTLISREALEKVGGIATGTITEDFETGLHIQEEGYTCYATSEVLAHGLAPDTVDSLIKQRERWGRGCIYSLHRAHVLRNKKIPFKSRLSYFACEIYWWSFVRRFVFMLAPILFMLFNVPVIVCSAWQMFLIWLPSYLMSLYASHVLSSDIRNSRWSNIVDTVMFPYLIIPLVMEAFGFKKREFHVTEKKRTLTNNSDSMLAIPHIILAVLSIVSILKCLGQVVEYETMGPFIVMYWLCVNLNALIMSIFFMTGRVNARATERYYVKIPACIKLAENNIYCETNDVSEGGISLISDKLIDIPTSQIYEIELRTHHYTAVLKAKIVHSEKVKDYYKYAFKIEELSDYDMGEYYQIVYDRHPSLPDIIEDNDSIYGGLKGNLMNRIPSNSIKTQKRRTERVTINDYMSDEEGKRLYVVNYNFRYLLIDPMKSYKRDLPSEMKVFVSAEDKDLYFDVKYRRTIGKGKKLYFVTNHSELAFNSKMTDKINNWLNGQQIDD